MHEDFAEKDSMALSESELPKLHAYQPLQLFFLLRLGRLLRLRHNVGPATESPPWLARLVSKAMYSTYRDCARLGLEEDANALFAKITAERRR